MTHTRGMQSFLPSGSANQAASAPDEPELKDNALEERVELRGIPSGKRKRPGTGARKTFSKPTRSPFPPPSANTGAGREMPMKSLTKRMPPMPPKRY